MGQLGAAVAGRPTWTLACTGWCCVPECLTPELSRLDIGRMVIDRSGVAGRGGLLGGDPGEVPQILLGFEVIFGSLPLTAFLWPATTRAGLSAATASRLVIHCARSGSPVSAVIMCTWL